MPTNYNGPGSGGDNREIVVVVPFLDERSIKISCGMQKDRFFKEQGPVICSESPARKVAELVVDALKSARFNVHTQDDLGNESSVKIQGTLLKFFAEPIIGTYGNIVEMDISVILKATSKNGLDAERKISIKVTRNIETMSEFYSDSYFQPLIDNATMQIVKEIGSAIAVLMNSYPQLGGV